MEEAFRKLEDSGLYETVLQLKRDLKLSKIKKAQVENLANDLLKAIKKLDKEEQKKEPFAYPKKQIDRSNKVIKTKPINEKVLTKFVNKMMQNGKLDEVKTKFIREDKIYKMKCFRNLRANKENLFPDMHKIYAEKPGKDSKSDQDQNDSRIGFEPRSLDGPSDTSVKFEHYRNMNDSKTDSNIPGMSDISGIRDSNVMESFAKRPRPSDTSHVDDSLRRKLDDTDTGVSRIEKAGVDETFLTNKSKRMINELEGEEELPDEYDDDDDAGFFTIEAGEGDFLDKCKQLAVEYNYPAAAVKPPDETDLKFEKERMKKLEEERLKEDETMTKKKKKEADADKEKLRKALGQVDDDKESEADSDESIPTQLPKWVKFVPCENEFYPAEFNGVVYDCYNLKVVFDREKTGFEESREFPIVPNSVIAGRFQVMEFLGQAAFSKAIR